MQFMQSEEQLAFAEAIDDIVDGAGGTQIARAWADGDISLGQTLWQQFTEIGLSGLVVDERSGGMGGSMTDLATVFERFGFHAVPGPYVESVALLPTLVSEDARAALLDGAVATAAVEGVHPFALDAQHADQCYVISRGATPDDSGTITSGSVASSVESMSPMRHLSRLESNDTPTRLVEGVLAVAMNRAAIANAAMLIGAGERLLSEAVEYAKVRQQFGRAIGEYQALKHQLADVRVALSFARPLVWNAAISLDASLGHADRDVSAAKIQASAASKLSARVALQVLGAIGYTSEHDVSIWLNWVPALVSVWGSPSHHRSRVARAVLTRNPLGG